MLSVDHQDCILWVPDGHEDMLEDRRPGIIAKFWYEPFGNPDFCLNWLFISSSKSLMGVEIFSPEHSDSLWGHSYFFAYRVWQIRVGMKTIWFVVVSVPHNTSCEIIAVAPRRVGILVSRGIFVRNIVYRVFQLYFLPSR